MANGWVKIHRKLLESLFYKDSHVVHIWVHLLLNATHKPIKALFKGKEITLKPGQLITGRDSISQKTKVNSQKVQRTLKKFEMWRMIEQQTSNRNRLVTILSWDQYQENEQQMNNKRTTDEQLVNTNKNINNKKKERKEIYKEKILAPDFENYTIPEKLYQWADKNGISKKAIEIHVEMCLNHFQDNKTKRPGWEKTIMNWARSDLAKINNQYPKKKLIT
jgi:hypothetical protein